MRAISIERTRRTVREATTSPRASFSLTLLRTISRADADMAFLPGNCSLLYARARGNPWSDRTGGAMRYDIVIRGGTVFDGSGRPGEHADVAIDGGRIAAIAPGISGRASRLLDAEGLAV